MCNTVMMTWGVRCPKCGNADEIDVAASVWVRLCADGTDPFLAACGDHEWTGDSEACCTACGFRGTVRDFEGGTS